MLVDDFRVERAQGVERFLATVRWENRTREPMEIHYVVQERDVELADLNPDAFRVPAAVIALREHESRIAGDGEICPALHDGLKNSLAWLRRWAGSTTLVPAIELPIGCSHPVPTGGGESGLLLSGGVDSLALLAHNHSVYPLGSERRFSVAIVVVGIQHHRWKGLADVQAQLSAARKQLAPIATATGIRLVPIATNITSLDRDGWFWKFEFQGAVLAGIGHLFARRISDLSIASTWDISHLDRWGSHPLIDPGFGTHSFRIWHELAHLGRLEKTHLVAQRPELLEQLNVCNEAAGGDRNCGRCEKCVRTMLALESMGRLAESEAFASATLQASDLRVIRIDERGLEGEYEELLEPLERVGRSDLASTIRGAIRIGRLRMRVPPRFRRTLRRLTPGRIRRAGQGRRRL